MELSKQIVLPVALFQSSLSNYLTVISVIWEINGTTCFALANLEESVSLYNGLIIPFPIPTDDTTQLTKVALRGLRKIYRSGYRYQKAGVMLSELVSANHRQADWLDSIAIENKSNQ